MSNYLRVAASEVGTKTATAKNADLDKMLDEIMGKHTLSSLICTQAYDNLGGQTGTNTRLGRAKDFTQEEAGTPQLKESEEERARKQEQEVEALQQKLSQIEQAVSSVTQETQNLITLIRQLEARLQDEEARRAVLEREYRTKKPTAEMLSDAENNIAQLQALSNAAAQRLLQLATEWEQHRLPLLKQYRDLKDAQLNKQDESKSKLEQIKVMRGQMKALVEEIHQKEDHYKQLVEAYENLPKDVTRAVYTRRILEIVKNVKKQKVDIDKILIETRSLRKEINTVTDTLGRVFAVVDELIFQDATTKKDQTAIQAYKHLAAMDEVCTCCVLSK